MFACSLRCELLASSPSSWHATVSYHSITTSDQLLELCDSLDGARIIAFDTEFVSEDRYEPELCLLQVCDGKENYIIDTLSVEDVTPFWQKLVSGDHVTLVHSGREEFRFCLSAVDRFPGNWFDVQLAAGMVGMEYPAAYGTLCSRLLKVSLGKGETRTDWRRRPLSQQQLDYAAQDVLHLDNLYGELTRRLEKLDRRSWFDQEMCDWLKNQESQFRGERWRSVSGTGSFPARILAIVRELWHWRDEVARSTNKLTRRVLRDDLLAELARRKQGDLKRIRSIRGMDHRHLQPHLQDIAAAVQRGIDLPEEECPQPLRSNSIRQRSSLCQFLAAALNAHCRQSRIAPNLVASMQNIRELVALRLDNLSLENGETPQLAQGWRKDLAGDLLDGVLEGKIAVQVEDPRAEHPLALRNRQETPGE
ncbi:MAG: ribonuclease D [Planctomycetaceae bacterium]|nr:ribonuclease D [Planctomycetaceae bacterium]